MTNVGEAVLDEYVAQVNEWIEDDKNKIRISQGYSFAHSLWRLSTVSLNLFFVALILVGFAMLASLDNDSINALRASSNADILNAIEIWKYCAAVVTVMGFFLIVVFSSHKYFHDKKQERLDWEKEQVELRKTIIEISEELLLRHKLIPAEKI